MGLRRLSAWDSGWQQLLFLPLPTSLPLPLPFMPPLCSLLTSSPPRSVPARNLRLTLMSASSGHWLYQSMVQQLMREGNWRHLQGGGRGGGREGREGGRRGKGIIKGGGEGGRHGPAAPINENAGPVTTHPHSTHSLPPLTSP